MPIKFACRCGRQLTAASEHAGRRAKCPSCGEVNVIPRADAAPAAAPAAVARPAAGRTAPRANGPAVAAPAPTARETLCAICQSPMGAGERRTACPACKAEYHQDCWQDNQGCAVYGCPEVPATEHREALEIP